MHVEAHDWVARYATDAALEAVEFGARDINGSIQPLFPNAHWTGVDIADGPGVDVVADASTYAHPVPVDLVVCCEVFEHTAAWPDIVENTFRILGSGGKAIFTAAGRGRPSHSAVDGLALRDWEHYANVSERDLLEAMQSSGFTDIAVHWLENPGDVRAYGRKP
jgi:SAM-dependent methyltransferase